MNIKEILNEQTMSFRLECNGIEESFEIYAKYSKDTWKLMLTQNVLGMTNH